MIVNRVWHWLFGAGLVRTVDNFGTTGERPSTPSCSTTWRSGSCEDGWSIKRLVRRIVLSRTYRLASVDDLRALAADPENRLLWRSEPAPARRRVPPRHDPRRSAGELRLEMGGPTFPAGARGGLQVSARRPGRSVYVPVFRNALPELFEVFDFADPSMVVGRRNVSTVAPQALFLMNHPFVVEQSRHAARRLLAEPGLDEPGRIDRAYRLALGRPPTEAERRIGLDVPRHRGKPSARRRGGVGDRLFRRCSRRLDFRYVD